MHSTSLQTTEKPSAKVVEECLRAEFFVTGLQRVARRLGQHNL